MNGPALLLAAALALPVNVADQRPAPPVRVASATVSAEVGGLRVAISYEPGSDRAVDRAWFGVVAVGADGRALWTWELAGPVAATGGRVVASWLLPASVVVPDGVRCPSLSSYPWECVGATRTVDLRREARRLDIVVSRAWFADGLGVWMGPPEWDRFGPPRPIHVIVDNLP